MVDGLLLSFFIACELMIAIEIYSSQALALSFFFKQEPVPRFWLLIRNNISNLNDTSSKYHKHQNSALTVILRHTMYTVFVWHCMLSIFITFNKMSILNAILKVTCCSFSHHFLQCKIKVCQGSHRVSPFFRICH